MYILSMTCKLVLYFYLLYIYLAINNYYFTDFKL